MREWKEAARFIEGIPRASDPEKHSAVVSALNRAAIFDLRGGNLQPRREPSELAAAVEAMPFECLGLVRDNVVIMVDGVEVFTPDSPRRPKTTTGKGLSSTGVIYAFSLAEAHILLVSEFGLINDGTSLIRRWCAATPKFFCDMGGRDVDPEQEEFAIDYLHKCLSSALHSILWINSPNNYVVKQSPERTKPQARPDLVARAYTRDIYTVLKPNEIKTRWTKAQPGTGAQKMPHLRRGHYVTLKHERFTPEMRGKRIWAKPCAIHGEGLIWEAGGRKYRVIQ